MLSFAVSLIFMLFVCNAQVIPDCPDRGETICLGHSTNRVSQSQGGTVSSILQDAYEQFCGCRYIKDNIVIQTGPTLVDANQTLVEANFSFLYYVKEISGYLELNGIPSIERLSLPNLRIIRGRNLRSGRYSLLALGKIQNLYMPNLTEISRGDVWFISRLNPYLCNTRSINWIDIAPFPVIGHRLETNGCSDSDIINCTALGCSSGSCWCNDTDCCQTLSFNCNCNNNRCFRNGPNIQCCNPECVAGCSEGGNNDQCRACKNVLNDGVCRERCPEQYIIDPDTRAVVLNPEFKFEAQPLCVSTCPAMLFELGTQCVEDCPSNYMSVSGDNGTMRCVLCDGPCPQECAGGVFDYDVPGKLSGCTIITTELRISSVPPNLDPSILNDLNEIREIRGSLDISGFNKETFPYLYNLKTVGNNDSNQVLSQSCNGSSDSFKYSIIIADTELVSIDLSSLEAVINGGVRLQNNPSLCYLGDLRYYLTNSSATSCILDDHRQSIEECVETNMTCHPQCSSASGWCWGPNDTQCVTCTNFIFNGQCVPTCNDFDAHGVHLYGHNANNTCLACHSFCSGSCVGEGPANCSSSCNTNFFVNVSVGVGIQCLESCVGDTYLPDSRTSGECLPCFSGCSLGYGCAGPGKTFNDSNGCMACDTILLDRNGDQIECQRDVTCPSGYYWEQLTEDRGIFLTDTVLCHSCHELCATCSGPSVSDCVLCSYIRGTNGSCVFMCDPIRETVPMNGSSQCIPVTMGTIDPSSAGTTGVVIGSALGGLLLTALVILIIVMLLVFVPRALRKKNKYNLNEVFSSPEELELFTLGKETLQPPRMAPNATRLIVAPEDELEFGKELGAGAFGTVYEGYWKPANDENEYHVAIKVLKNTSASASKELLQEGVVMATMDHENVVRLYCVCMSKQLMLVSQFVPCGALIDYIKKQQDRLNAHTILLFSSQIANGMAYLETKHLVHRDLAARNVLVQTPVKVKITDFGLTRIIEANQSHYEATTSKMPVRWLPPESIRNRVFTHKTDVWSFGVTVWEILTFGARPYQGKKPYEILKMLEGGHRLDQPVTCTIDLYAVLLECWLLEPDSRPNFVDLGRRFHEFMNDPARYVLTVLDGNTSDYLMLPSNVSQPGDNAYEQPVTNETCPSAVSIQGTLPSSDNAVNPYAMAFSAEAYVMHPPDATPVVFPTKKLNDGQEYEVPVEGSSPVVKAPRSPRYVDLLVPAKQSNDYVDEKIKLLPNEDPDDDYTLMSDVAANAPSHSAADIIENYEFSENPQPLGSPLSPNDKMPLLPSAMGGGVTNLLYDNNAGSSVPEVHNYEDVDEEANKGGLTNLVYDSRAGEAEPLVHNYEDMEDDQNGVTNLMYDSRAGQAAIPAANNYEDMEDDRNGVSNLMYDSRAGTSSVSAVPDVNNYEDIDEDVPSGVSNVMYDSRAGTSTVNAVPDVNNYEDIDEDVPNGVSNVMYDSRAGTSTVNAVPDVNNYEDIDEDVPNGVSNIMYDSRAGTSTVNAVPDDNNYEDIDEDVPSGVSNVMYDSRAGTSTVNAVPDDNNYEDIDEDVPNGVSNVMYDSTAGTSKVPETHNYKDVEDVGNQPFSFSNLMYDSRAGTSTNLDNYEEIDESSPKKEQSSFSNVMYDSRAGIAMNGHSSSNERTMSPYEVPIAISPTARTVSPYEVPVKDGDYELPTDGMPRVPQYNVYEAPAS